MRRGPPPVALACLCALVVAVLGVGVAVTRSGPDAGDVAVTSSQDSGLPSGVPSTSLDSWPSPRVEVRQDQAIVSAPAAPVTAPAADPCGATPMLTEYALPGRGLPASIAPGEGGSVWFTDADTHSIGHLQVSGALTRYVLPAAVYPGGIARGPNGDLWFTDAATAVDANRGSPVPPAPNIGRITPAGVVTLFPLPTREQNHLGGPGMGSLPFAITAGPDGAMWFTEAGADQIGRITNDGVISELPLPSRSSMHAHPTAIVTGPDGAIWFTQPLRQSIGRIDVSTYAMSESFLPSPGPGLARANVLASGPTGSLWFDDPRTSAIGRLTPSGQVGTVALPDGARPIALTAGPDGNIWFIEGRSRRVARVTPSGSLTEFAVVDGQAPVAVASAIAVASDRAVWFTTGGTNKLGRITCGRP